MCVGVAFLCNNESNEPQNVNKRDHVQESNGRLWSGLTIIKKTNNWFSCLRTIFLSILVILTNFMNFNKTFLYGKMNDFFFQLFPAFDKEKLHIKFCILEKNSGLYQEPSSCFTSSFQTI